MSGLDSSTFGTENPVTREQFCLVMQKLAQLYELDTVADGSVLSQFGDEGDISSWATTGVAWSVENGLIKGSDGKLNPSGEITRAEVAVMLNNFSGMI